jgi:hypothetical protein
METAEIIVLLPVHNEEDVIEQVVLGCFRELSCHFSVTLEISKTLPLKVILGPERRGYEGATKTGLSHRKSDLVFVLDSDGQAVSFEFWINP